MSTVWGDTNIQTKAIPYLISRWLEFWRHTKRFPVRLATYSKSILNAHVKPCATQFWLHPRHLDKKECCKKELKPVQVQGKLLLSSLRSQGFQHLPGLPQNQDTIAQCTLSSLTRRIHPLAQIFTYKPCHCLRTQKTGSGSIPLPSRFRSNSLWKSVRKASGALPFTFS